MSSTPARADGNGPSRSVDSQSYRQQALLALLNPIAWAMNAQGLVLPPASHPSGPAPDSLWLQWLHPNDRSAAESWWRNSPDHSQNRFACRIATGPDSWEAVQLRLTPVRDPGGTVLEWVGVAEPVSAAVNLAASEKRFRAAIQAVSSIVWTNDITGQMTGDQPGWAAFTGQSREEYQGYGWSRVVHPEDAQPSVDEWNRSVAARCTFVWEHRVRRADGEWRLCSIRAVPVLNDDGSIAEWVGVHTDITEIRAAEEERERLLHALELEQSRLQTLLDHAPVGIDFVSTAGEVLLTSREVERILRHPVTRGLDHLSQWRACHPDGRRLQGEEYPVVQALRTGEVVQGEYLYERGDGTRGWVRLIGAPVRNRDGHIIAGASAVVDIDDAKRAEQSLREAEDRLRRALVAAHVGVWDWHITEDRLVLSEGYEALYGRTPGEIVTEADLLACVHPDDQDCVRQARVLSPGGQGLYDVEYRVVWPDGTVRWLKSQGRVTRYEQDRPVLISGAVLDVTDRRLAEDALRESEGRFRQMANAMPQIVWTARADGTLDYFNERWFSVNRQLEGSARDTDWAPVVHPDDLAGTVEVWAHAVATGEPYTRELRLWDGTNNSWRWHLARAALVKDDGGLNAKWVGTTTDIHELKTVEEALRRSNEDLQQFAYAASHDLQEPLRTISSFATLLARRQRDRLDEESKEFIRSIVDGAKRMRTLIDDLLYYSRATSEQERVPVVTDLEDVLASALAGLHATLSQSKSLVTWDPLPTVIVDPGQLTQVFQNLISNAVKYRRPQHLAQIHISSTLQSHEWVFAVRDNGIGFKPQYAEQIFGIFKRLHGRSDYPGTGIGLAIVKTIVERHGGRAWAEGATDAGATFYFTLPAIRGQETA